MDGKILKDWLDEHRYTVSWLAERLGNSPQSVYEQLRKEKIGEVFKSKLRRIGIDAFESTHNKVHDPDVKYSQNNKLNLMIVPLKAYGGFLNGYANRVFLDSLEYAQFPFIKGECFAFEVDGYSMMPGDYAVCTEIPDVSWLTKGKIYVFQTIDGLIIKEFEKISDNECYLKSLNDDYNPVRPIPVKSIKKVYYKEYIIKK